MANPTFDKEDVTYQPRYGVYQLFLMRKKQIVLVQAPNGAWLFEWRKLKLARSSRSKRFIRQLQLKLGLLWTRLMSISTLATVIPTTTIQLISMTISFQSTKTIEGLNHIAWIPIDETIEKLKHGNINRGGAWKIQHGIG